MKNVTNLRAEIFDDLLTLRADLLKAAKYWKKRCTVTAQLFQSSAKKLSTIINYRKDDHTVEAILKEIGSALSLHSATAIFEEARIDASTLSHRALKLLPEGKAFQLELFAQ